ncbi:unnamed protein product [Schistosoma turkestanicum]|nr:unnamed protein product [Schistosoma turkestanicum]
MALLDLGITQDIPLIVEKSEKLDFSISPGVNNFLPLSSARGKFKRTKKLENQSPFTTDSYSTSTMVKENKYSNRRSGLTPSAKRLHMSCSASASPMKSVVIPKRLTRSQSNSPCEKLKTYPLADNSNDFRFIHRHKSTDNECILSDSSSIVPSPNIFSNGFFDFTMCDQCSDLRSHSLDSWMDHLGELHPVPVHWPSSRADRLNELEKRYPYTTVVGSNKKRKASAIPRPLNSFMIFAQYLRRIVLHWFPDAPNVHISQRVGQLWRKLDLKMRDKYIDEAFRLQQLHAIEFPDYKYRPKKRARNVAGTDNNIEADEYISKSENVIPITSKSITFNDNSHPGTKCENVHFPSGRSLTTCLNNRNSDENHSHTPLLIEQHKTTAVNSVTCSRNYLQPNQQVINKMNMELYQPVKADYNSRTTRISNPYDKKVSTPPGVNDNHIFKLNKEVDETMTLLVSGSAEIGHGAYQMHKTIPRQTNDRITESLVLPSSALSQGNQIKEIQILNMQSPNVQQLANGQPIICRTFLCEPLKATVISQPGIIPIKTNGSMLNGLILDTNVNNFGFHPFPTKAIDSTTSSLYPKIDFYCNKVNSNPLSKIELENVVSQCVNSPSARNHSKDYPRGRLGKKYVRKDCRILSSKQSVDNGKQSATTDSYEIDVLSSRHTNTPLFLESLRLKCENDNVDAAFSFTDIDTCKSGTSLDDLEQISLFSCESTSDVLQTLDALNSPTEDHSSFVKSESMYNHQLMKTPHENSFTQSNGLPSIESWTFGTSKTSQIS